VFTKNVLSMDGKTKYGKVMSSAFHIPSKVNYWNQDGQLVSSVQWHFFSFVGAHDFLDCKGKKVAESEEAIESKLMSGKSFSLFKIKNANGDVVAQSSKTKFFNHQVNLDDPNKGTHLITIDKNFMSLSNTWKVHMTDSAKGNLVGEPGVITLLAGTQEGVPFLGWGSIPWILFTTVIVLCCCGCCFGFFKMQQKKRQGRDYAPLSTSDAEM